MRLTRAYIDVMPRGYTLNLNRDTVHLASLPGVTRHQIHALLTLNKWPSMRQMFFHAVDLLYKIHVDKSIKVVVEESNTIDV